MGSKNKTFVVVNPAAGGGLGRRLWPQTSRELEKRIGPFDFEETNAVGHGRLLAAEAAQAGYAMVVSYGGDGTIHEVANGIFDSGGPPRPVLGVLCVGTGSDLIKTLKIPKNLADQIRILAGDKTRRIDLGRIDYTIPVIANEGRSPSAVSGATTSTRWGSRGRAVSHPVRKERRIFINIASAGLSAEVDRRVHQSSALFGRRLAYLSSTVQSCLAWRPKRITIDLNNSKKQLDWSRKTYLVIVANGKYFGGGMPIAPGADPSDGSFDLVAVGDLSPLMVPVAIPLLYLKKLSLLPNVRSLRVRKVTLKSDEPVHLDIDGEAIGSLPATFEILPQALEVKVP